MSEIEKLYKNAEVEHRYTGCYYNLPCCRNCNKNYKDTIDKTCKYQIVKEEYPPFTAEKQIELIKKLGNINIDIDNGCYMSSEILKVEAHCDTLEETLAEFVNNLWQNLTNTEKAEIKEILTKNLTMITKGEE